MLINEFSFKVKIKYTPELITELGDPVTTLTSNGIKTIIGTSDSSYPKMKYSPIYEHRIARTKTSKNIAMRKILEEAVDKQKNEKFRDAVKRTMKEDPLALYPMSEDEIMQIYKKTSNKSHYESKKKKKYSTSKKTYRKPSKTYGKHKGFKTTRGKSC